MITIDIINNIIVSFSCNGLIRVVILAHRSTTEDYKMMDAKEVDAVNEYDAAIDSIQPLTIVANRAFKTAIIVCSGFAERTFVSTVILNGKKYEMEFTSTAEDGLNEYGKVQAFQDAYDYALNTVCSGNEFVFDDLPKSAKGES